MSHPELVQALWSLKEDATYAWKLAMGGDESGLEAVGRSMKQLEQAVMRRDLAVKPPPPR